jgi:prepilin-type N-terminal cleavage/methylation domain-containing protein
MRRVPVRGFTLIELLISIGIIGIISSIVVVKFSSFDSSVLLKSAAYEVALALRDAQVYSVSVYGQNSEFDYPYGVTFDSAAGANRIYTFFTFQNADTSLRPKFDGNAQSITAFTTTGSIEIYDICAKTSTNEYCKSTSAINRLDISFRRPEFRALFYAEGLLVSQDTVTSAKIKVKSTKGTDIWVVEVGLLGHVSVYKQ